MNKKRGYLDDFTDYILAALLLFFIIVYLSFLNVSNQKAMSDLKYGEMIRDVEFGTNVINYLRSSVDVDNDNKDDMIISDLITLVYVDRNKYKPIFDKKTKEIFDFFNLDVSGYSRVRVFFYVNSKEVESKRLCFPETGACSEPERERPVIGKNRPPESLFNEFYINIQLPLLVEGEVSYAKAEFYFPVSTPTPELLARLKAEKLRHV